MIIWTRLSIMRQEVAPSFLSPVISLARAAISVRHVGDTARCVTEIGTRGFPLLLHDAHDAGPSSGLGL